MQVTIALIEFLLVGLVSLIGLALVALEWLARYRTNIPIPDYLQPAIVPSLGLLAYLLGALLNRVYDLLTDIVRLVAALIFSSLSSTRVAWLEEHVSERSLATRVRLKDFPDVAARLDYLGFLLRLYRASIWSFALVAFGVDYARGILPDQVEDLAFKAAIGLSMLSSFAYFYERYRLFRLFEFLEQP